MASASSPAVFVVDDDEVVRDSLKVLLESRGFTVHDFASGRQFLDRKDGVTADCLILDVHMPDMTGTELLKILRNAGDLLPVILITGRNDPVIQAQAKEFGAVTLLDKPVAHAALFAAIQQAVVPPR